MSGGMRVGGRLLRICCDGMGVGRRHVVDCEHGTVGLGRGLLRAFFGAWYT